MLGDTAVDFRGADAQEFVDVGLDQHLRQRYLPVYDHAWLTGRA